jgi:hypothetical protein
VVAQHVQASSFPGARDVLVDAGDDIEVRDRAG